VKIDQRLRLKWLLVGLIILAGLIEYIKIGNALINEGTQKQFIRVSPFSKGAGEIDSLPPQVLDIKKLSDRNNISEFDLQFGAIDDSLQVLITARTLEFLYPKRISHRNNMVFLVGEDSKLKGCKEKDHLNEVGLYECPDKKI